MSGATRFGIVDHARTRREASEVLARLGVSLDPRARVGSLSVADQQMVEIARALVHKVKLLVLDEPTAVIAGREATLLFDRLRRLRDSGVSVIFISHRLEEVFALCDRVTVLKDGKLVGTRDVAERHRERLISMMVGRDLGELFPPKARSRRGRARPVLRTEACRSPAGFATSRSSDAPARSWRWPAWSAPGARSLRSAFSAPCRFRAAPLSSTAAA